MAITIAIVIAIAIAIAVARAIAIAIAIAVYNTVRDTRYYIVSLSLALHTYTICIYIYSDACLDCIRRCCCYCSIRTSGNLLYGLWKPKENELLLLRAAARICKKALFSTPHFLRFFFFCMVFGDKLDFHRFRLFSVCYIFQHFHIFSCFVWPSWVVCAMIWSESRLQKAEFVFKLWQTWSLALASSHVHPERNAKQCNAKPNNAVQCNAKQCTTM